MISKCAKTYCNEDISLIENYDKAISDKEQIWHCHHRRELETPRKELIKIGEYYKRPARELIFLTKYEHNSLHSSLKFKGKHMSEEHKRKLSEAHKGNRHSDETKRKMSDALKRLHWFNNGIKNVRAKSCPEGFVKGRLKHN